MRSLRFILFLGILHLKQIQSDGDLPMGAKTVDKCPEPMNSTAWEMASKRLGCAHSGKISSEQNQVYHCLASSLLNEYVEFCGITAPIDRGNCPVLHYVNTRGRNRSPTSRNCSKFTSGCPQEFYYSRDVYMYPECLSIDRNRRCFRADISCMNGLDSTSTIEYNTVVINKNEEQIWDTFGVVHWLLIFSVIVICVLVVIILKLTLLHKGRKDKKKTNFKGEGYQAAHLLLKYLEEKRQEEGEGEGCQAAPLLLKDRKEKHQEGEESSSSSDTDMSFKEKTSFNEISVSPVARLLCRIAEALPSEKIAKLKFLFKANYGENSEEENGEISALDRYEFFQYMHRLYDFNLNLYILMGYLEEIKELKLLKICEKFAKSADHPLNYYTRNRRDMKEYTKVYLKVAMDLEASNRQNIVNIVKNIQKLLVCKKEDIFVQGISEGCILFHLDVRSTLLETLRKCDFTCLRKLKVFKISIMEECIFHCPNLDDNCHRKEDPEGNFKVRMFYLIGFLMRTFMELCKICRRGKQSRISGEMCNKEDLTRKTVEFRDIEPLKPSEECLRTKVNETLNTGSEMCNKELLTKTTIKESKNIEPLESSKECIEDELTGKPSTEFELRFGEGPEQPTMLYRRMDETKSMPKEIPGSEMCNKEDLTRQTVDFMDIEPLESSEECLENVLRGKANAESVLIFGEDSEHTMPNRHMDETKLMLKENPECRGKIMDIELKKKQGEINKKSITKKQNGGKLCLKDEIDMQGTLDVKEKALQGELDVKVETDMQLDQLHRRSNFRRVYSYNCLQEDIVEVFSSIETLADLPAFDCHIRRHSHKMDDIMNYLELRKNGLMKADCVVVVTRETSSKKSSIINLLIGKDIVPTDIMATTTRVCRIKYSDRMRISTLDKKGKELERTEFKEEEKFNEMMEDLATREDNQIEYIHVWFPVPILKVHEEAHQGYDNFHAPLKEVNGFKMMRIHLGFINSFVDDCDVILSCKLKCARQSREETIKEFDQLCTDLQIITKKRKEVYSSLQHCVDQCLEETTEELYQYIHSSEFSSLVLQGIEKCNRFTTRKELDTRIEKATLSWQQENIGKLFERKILQNLTDNFVKLHESLHKIKNKMKGFKSPFDVEDKLGSVLASLIAPSGADVAGRMAIMYMSAGPKAAAVVAAAEVVTGLIFTGLVALDVLDDFETVTKNAYKARIDKLTKEKIREKLHRSYAERFRDVIRSYLEGDLKREIEDLSAGITSAKSKIDFYKTEESILLGLSSEISKIRNQLEVFKIIETKLY